jgi:hypothetical protein
MSPTIFRSGPYRFLFFSREEPRMHVHVQSADGEAKYWLEPEIELAQQVGFRGRDLARIEALIREHENDIRTAWNERFGGG